MSYQKRRVNRSVYVGGRRWTRLEVAIWFFALAFVIASGILLVTQAVGHWVVLVGGMIAVTLGLMRYRAENQGRSEKVTLTGE